ncbi:hypothetical protein HPB48_018709 [Haemaphysalis longicornis]|uniref:Uncharacterized protein n=1 Tax=Haemaphysalis longicornis TaxID=44386 RepID=A0A9J6G0I4_HAELO|nr:hypothetical protein HPB48_018709 [Haemaphysalis longicornis]
MTCAPILNDDKRSFLRCAGRRVMEQFDLLLTPQGYSHSYNTELNAGIANVFAAAAYRYGHSLVQVGARIIPEVKFATLFQRVETDIVTTVTVVPPERFRVLCAVLNVSACTQ